MLRYSVMPLSRFYGVMAKLIRHLLHVIKGAYALCLILKAKKSSELVLISERGIGDTLYCMANIDALLSHENYAGKNFLVIGNEENRRLFECFLRGNRVALKLLPRKAYRFLQEYFGSPKLIKTGMRKGIFNPNPFNPAFLTASYSSESIDILSVTRKLVFNIPADAPISYHNLKKQRVTAIPGFERNKHRIVILNPYSNSMGHRAELYEPLCEELTKRNFIVFTNVSSQQGVKSAVKGSLPLECSICELYSIMCEIPLFVSVRSGIVDLCITSGVNIFALYYNCPEEFRQLFALSAWKCKGIVREVYISTDEDIKNVPEKFSAFLYELQAEGRLPCPPSAS